MAKSALLEQYSNIWFDKQDYLEAERAYYEGKLGQVGMGRKNKSKQGSVPTAADPPSTAISLHSPNPISPPPITSPEQSSVEKKRNDSECSNKVKGEVKGSQGGKNKKGQTAKQCPVQSGEVTPKPVEGVKISGPPPSTSLDISSGVEKAAQTNYSDTKMDGVAKLSADTPAVLKKISALETENKTFKKEIQDLTALVKKLELRLSSLESGKSSSASGPTQNGAAAPSKAKAPAKAADDDDVDLFGSDSDEENEEAAKIREERLAAYNAKKSKKPVLIAKSNIILDVKPWGDDTDMKEMEKQVRAIKMDGLLWGASKLAPLAYGINKLQISSVVEDELVSVDALTEAIQDIEEYVQSVDIAAFNKV